MVSFSEVPLDSPVAVKSYKVQVGRGEASRSAGTARALELLLQAPAGRQWRRSPAVGPQHRGTKGRSKVPAGTRTRAGAGPLTTDPGAPGAAPSVRGGNSSQ